VLRSADALSMLQWWRIGVSELVQCTELQWIL